MACREEVVKKLSGLPPVIDVITRSKNLNNTAPADSEGAINKFMGLFKTRRVVFHRRYT